MRESYGEGAANHTGPESFVAHRKGRHEALSGERRARTWNRETSKLQDTDALATGGRQHLGQP